MRGTETHEIKGKSYEFCLMPPAEALRILTRLIKRTLPSVGGAFSGGDLKGITEAVNGAVNLDALAQNLASNLEEQEVEETVKAILKHVRVDGREININVEFPGEIMTMLAVVYKALEVNYADFFAGLKERFGAIIKKNSSQAPKPRSTGSSGA